MSKNDGILYLPRTEESVPTPRTRENAFHATKPRTLVKPKNFDKAMARLKAKGNLDGHDFSSGEEMGMFIDLLNAANTKAKEKHAHNEIVEIAKFLANIESRKMFIPKPKQT